MRWLAIASALVITGCASAPSDSPNGIAVAAYPPPTIERPWLVQRPSDEITLFDTRTLQALRKPDDTEALHANGSGRVKRPGLWIGVGVGVATAGILVADDVVDESTDIADTLFGCLFDALFGDDCDEED